MAKTVQSIRMTYQSAMQETKGLKELAKKIDKERIHIESCKTILSANWQGTAAGNYIQKLEVKSCDLTDIAKQIRQIAETIEFIAMNTYKADKKAIDLANQRKYLSGGNGNASGGMGGGGGGTF